MNMKDHDMLVTLNTKMDGVVVDIKDLKDGLSTRLSAVETRVKIIEDKTVVVDPVNLPKDLDKIKILESQAKWVGVLLAPIYLGIVGFLVAKFTGLFK